MCAVTVERWTPYALASANDTLTGLMALDQLVDLAGCQEGLSRPDLTYDNPVSPDGAGLLTVRNAAERAPSHA